VERGHTAEANGKLFSRALGLAMKGASAGIGRGTGNAKLPHFYVTNSIIGDAFAICIASCDSKRVCPI
jgi:hypothetical protein